VGDNKQVEILTRDLLENIPSTRIKMVSSNVANVWELIDQGEVERSESSTDEAIHRIISRKNRFQLPENMPMKASFFDLSRVPELKGRNLDIQAMTDSMEFFVLMLGQAVPVSRTELLGRYEYFRRLMIQA
jgi:hypothetical protein